MTVKEIIILTASYYEKAISPQVLEMYVGDLTDLPESKVIAAYHAYRKNHKNRQMPLPAQIREMVEPVADNDSAAKEIASRIQSAVSKFGYTNPSEAKLFIGSVGWKIVDRYGGWAVLCQNLGTVLDIGTFHAQVRDLAKAHLTFGEGGFDKALQIESSKNDSDQLISANSILKNLLPSR
jgi:hypothetical protein